MIAMFEKLNKNDFALLLEMAAQLSLGLEDSL